MDNIPLPQRPPLPTPSRSNSASRNDVPQQHFPQRPFTSSPFQPFSQFAFHPPPPSTQSQSYQQPRNVDSHPPVPVRRMTVQGSTSESMIDLPVRETLLASRPASSVSFPVNLPPVESGESKQMPDTSHTNGGQSSSSESTNDPLPQPASSSSKPSKKRARQSSHNSPPISTSNANEETRDNAPAHNSNSTSNSNRTKSGEGTTSKDSLAVLIREKKQRACSNCRKTKLKCVVEPGETICVRCKAREEKCVFYPRSQDDDWQQAITSDLYAATTQLSHISAAVHHMMSHLVQNNIIPPFVPPNAPGGLPTYQAPDRDVSAMLGWFAPDKNKDSAPIGGNGNKTEKKGKKHTKINSDEVDEIEEEEETAHRDYLADNASMAPTQRGIGASTTFTIDNQLPPLSQLPVPPTPAQSLIPSYSPMPRNPSISSSSRPSLAPHQHSSDSSAIQLSPLLDMGSARLVPFNSILPAPQPFLHNNVGAATVPPPIEQQQQVHRSDSFTMPKQNTPTSLTNVTPNSRVSSSPILHTPHAEYLDPQQRPPDQVYHPQRHSTSSMRDDPTNVPGLQGEYVDENGMEVVIGSADPRQDIVKKGIVSNHDALTMVNYFHRHLSYFLYGYQLQFRKFPYLEGGPATITPLILAVLCLATTDRNALFSRYHGALIEEVLLLLKTSPAESWQRFEGSYTADFGDVDSDEPLDAEFGLGPEEIVAACVLATWMTEREEAAMIARSAFRWARGWIRLLSSTPPRVTLAETAGFVPPERQASAQDMTRIWLLCYIVDSTERLQLSFPPPPPRDALSYCNVLVPTNSSTTDEPPNANDILLTFHARLMTILNEWRHRLGHILSGGETGGGHPNPTQFIPPLKRLASRVNGQLEWWKEQFNTVRSSLSQNAMIVDQQTYTRHIEMTWLFVKMSVNGTIVKCLYQPGVGGDESRLREASSALVVDCAIEFLEICARWTPREGLMNLSPAYLFFISVAGGELVDAIGRDNASARSGAGSGMGCVISPDEAIPLLRTVGEMLYMGQLHEKHVTRMTAKTLFGYCDQLQMMR
ncbi:hypothetical protein CI109_102128 [Kwoniella shandongensis]|uniref:Uncharacterized protein n=1 Tax=Kwoniella shandongensis TaxID=1734106 RepID=A0A5M6BYX2_9TREE|nr:uncharacterized protein CI109_003712 [Kwoniella shandongensis]KAA5528057.1 hypothetical protein CI109_003712 [Kwoniella shandongensis]